MSPLRRVFGERAGPSALGILVPPGRRTVLILRPRALPWDLVLARPAGAAFWELDRAEAEATAERLCRALEEWQGGGAGQVAPVPLANGAGHHVRAEVGPFCLVVCPRRPGEPYQPALFADAEEARGTAAVVAGVLCPPPGTVQEVYFNTRFFARGE